MRPFRPVGRFGAAVAGFVAGAAAAGCLVVGISLVSDAPELGLGISLLFAPVLLVVGLLLGASGRRGWLLGAASGAALSALVWYWAFAMLRQSQ